MPYCTIDTEVAEIPSRVPDLIPGQVAGHLEIFIDRTASYQRSRSGKHLRQGQVLLEADLGPVEFCGRPI